MVFSNPDEFEIIREMHAGGDVIGVCLPHLAERASALAGGTIAAGAA